MRILLAAWGSREQIRNYMRILDRYIGGQVLMATLFAVFLLCIVLVLGNMFRTLFPLIANGMISPVMAGKFVLFILPYSLAYTIPWGFLTAVLIVFGRLSADAEFVAIRGAGVSFFRISLPVGVLAVVFSLFCFFANCYLAPLAQKESKKIINHHILTSPERMFVPKEPSQLMEGLNIWVGEREETTLKNLYIFQSQKHRVGQFIFAEEADLSSDVEKQQLFLDMRKAYLEFNEHENSRQVAKKPMFAGAHSYTLDLSQLSKRKFFPSQMSNAEIHEALRTNVAEGADPLRGNRMDESKRQELHFELSKRWSLGFACLAFAVIAIPLGVTSQRRETSVGFVISLGLALAYYFFVFLAQTSGDKGAFLSYFLLWMPNVLFLVLGIILLLRLNKT